MSADRALTFPSSIVTVATEPLSSYRTSASMAASYASSVFCNVVSYRRYETTPGRASSTDEGHDGADGQVEPEPGDHVGQGHPPVPGQPGLRPVQELRGISRSADQQR